MGFLPSIRAQRSGCSCVSGCSFLKDRAQDGPYFGGVAPIRAARPLLYHSALRRNAYLSVGFFEGCDELGQVLVSDPAQLSDLDAAEVPGPEQKVDLVTADVQQLRHLLDGVRLQGRLTSPRYAA